MGVGGPLKIENPRKALLSNIDDPAIPKKEEENKVEISPEKLPEPALVVPDPTPVVEKPEVEEEK